MNRQIKIRLSKFQQFLQQNRRKLILASGATLLLATSAALTLVLLQAKKPVPTPQARQKAQITPTPAGNPLQPDYYVTTSQKFFTKAEEYSAKQNQTAAEKERILAMVQNALTTINQGIRHYPNDDRLYAQRAKIYQGIADFSPKSLNNALADLEKARQLSPQNPAYPKKISKILAKSGEFQDASYYANLAYELEPSNLQTLADLGQVQVQAGQIKNALHSYQKLLSLLPTNDAKTKQVQQEVSSLESLLAQAETNQKSQLHLAGTTPQPTPDLNQIPAEIQLLPQREAGLPENLAIASSSEDNQSQENDTSFNATAGKATLPAGEKEITIYNKNIDEKVQILISPTTDTENQNLFVSQKQAQGEKPYFKVAIHSPIEKDVKLKWWIISE